MKVGRIVRTPYDIASTDTTLSRKHESATSRSGSSLTESVPLRVPRVSPLTDVVRRVASKHTSN